MESIVTTLYEATPLHQELLRTARDLTKAVLRAQPHRLAKGDAAKNAISIHAAILEGLTKQTDNLVGKGQFETALAAVLDDIRDTTGGPGERMRGATHDGDEKQRRAR